MAACARRLRIALHLTTVVQLVLHAAELQLFISVISGSLFTVHKLGPKKLKIFMAGGRAGHTLQVLQQANSTGSSQGLR